jgi:hypothetical protein
MAKRNKKATRKIERLRDRLHHVDENPDFKVGWLTQYMFVMDNFDIGETKRANENRWLYTIGPQRRTRYPFETMVIPGTHYTLHWFMQCKISDPSQVPEFKYVPISTGATTLPFGTAPYVPTVQISQTKSDWSVVMQDSYVSDAHVILQCLAKCLNQHNFTIFDARDLMPTLTVSLPLITHDETICELEFLERQRKGIVVSYSNRYKRKSSPVKLEGSSHKKPRLEVTSISSATRMLLDLLTYGPVSIAQAAQQFQVKEKLIEQVVDVLMVVGQVTMANGLITSTTLTTTPSHCPPSPRSPKSPASSCDDSYGPIPETPPQSMPMWDSSRSDQAYALSSSTQPSTSRPYATRSSTVRKVNRDEDNEQNVLLPSLYQPMLPSQSLLTRPPFHLPGSLPHNPPPPTQPARSRDSDRVWASPLDVGSFSSNTDKFHKSIANEMGFDANLDLSESSILDFFQSSFWDQY